MYRANYHTHGQWCNHGTGEEKEFVKEALKAEVWQIGFSEHLPFPDNRLYRMDFSQLPDYTSKVYELREKCESGIRMFCGGEIEYFPEMKSYYRYLVEDGGFHYLILGQHYFKHGEAVQRTKKLEETKEILNYAYSIREALETGSFKILAHPDYFGYVDFEVDGNIEKAIDVIIEAAVETNTLLEVNANGFRKPCFQSKLGMRRRYPLDCFWARAAEKKAKVIIGSDCHANGCLYDEAVKQCEKYILNKKLNQIKHNVMFLGD